MVVGRVVVVVVIVVGIVVGGGGVCSGAGDGISNGIGIVMSDGSHSRSSESIS